jgi:hypothetical protein
MRSWCNETGCVHPVLRRRRRGQTEERRDIAFVSARAPTHLRKPRMSPAKRRVRRIVK